MTDPLPRILDHEALLISTLLWHPSTYPQVRWLDPETFQSPVMQRMYSAFRYVMDQGCDAETVIEKTNEALYRYAPNNEELRRLFNDIVTLDRGFPSQIAYHARAIFDTWRRARICEFGTRIAQMSQSIPDMAELMVLANHEIDNMRDVIGATCGGFDPINGLYTVPEFLATGSSSSHQWVVPGLLEAQERLILVAPVKAGKSVMTRQYALALAMGQHPMWPTMGVTPRRTLLIDLENPVGVMKRDLNRQIDGFGRMAEECENAWVLHRPAGIHLGDPKDATMIERAIDVTGAELVALCPLYKAYDGLGESWEQQAFGVQKPLDKMREKYGCAWWIEHHSPKGMSTELFGSSRWSRWFDMKVALVPEDPDQPPPYNALRWLGTYREESRLCPKRVTRGTQASWEATFPSGFHDLLAEACVE